MPNVLGRYFLNFFMVFQVDPSISNSLNWTLIGVYCSGVTFKIIPKSV